MVQLLERTATLDVGPGTTARGGKAVPERLLPYRASFQQLATWRRVGSVLLYAISALSVIIPLTEAHHFHGRYVATALSAVSFLNFFLIITYYIINVVTETFIYPAAARLRRVGFVDNSLGSKFLGQDVIGYFTSDPIPVGPYKLIVNCFENCYFTYNIARAMTIRIVSKNALLAAAFLTIAYFGIRKSSIGLPILQILLSSVFITELIHHLNFITKLRGLLDRFKGLFADGKKAIRGGGTLPNAILMLLEYETTLAFNKSPLSDKIYRRLSDRLSKEWEELKSYYAI